ncbi:MAG: cardiolipin synthase [Bacteriovoracia bacterium]
MLSIHIDYLSFSLLVVFYLTGFALAINAVFQARTPQGTVAWILGLIFFPFLAIPLFLLFGKKRLDHYEKLPGPLIPYKKNIEANLSSYRFKEYQEPIEKFLTHTEVEYLTGNKIKLLINGKEVFEEMIGAVKKAERYIFLQMYIFRADVIGKTFIEALKFQSLRGIQVYVQVERLGLHLSKSVLRGMKEAGIHIGTFSPVHSNILHYNFRNHRKLLIIDGVTGFYGGINIGDDYLGRYPEIGFWRDSNVRIDGPSVYYSQMEFLKDWHWARNETINVDYRVPVRCGDVNIMILNSDPSDENHNNLLQHIEIINSSKKRIWIANPYLIPPQGIIDALVIASKRGVDVRILVPEKSDNFLVQMASEAFLEKFWKAGIRIYKYTKGMMHQKVILLDETLALIGSSNLDYRSMYINFENSIITSDPSFLLELEFSFREDFNESYQVQLDHFKNLKFGTKLVSRFANCLSPIL